jgi:hypothetical protein
VMLTLTAWKLCTAGAGRAKDLRGTLVLQKGKREVVE